ncbi:DUF3108 domain-containing protein [Prosthecomicrobium sp. N25]|uniref:DUF3108 domain-containing protein n=1 Tax=Prosthecomicrobium sp. N25 TaxID=3129254 RepID=UPI003076B178
MAVSRRLSYRRAALAGAALAVLGSTPALAQTRVVANYDANLSGFSVASGELSFDLSGGGDYQASLGARVVGFAAMMGNRSAQASAAGKAQPGNTLSRSYALAVNGGPIANVVSMTFAGGSVASLTATELRTAGADQRIPVTAQHKRGVVDPLGAFVVTVPSANDALTPKVCNRTLKVFDGRVRYDLRLVYGAKTEIRGGAGSYSGPAVICSVGYRPIAGFRPLSPEQARFERNLEFSIWFVPVGQTNVLIPYKVVIGTQMGLLTVAASRFEVTGSRTAEAADRTTVVGSVRGKSAERN